MEHDIVESQLCRLVDESEHLVIEVHPERSDSDVPIFSPGQGVDALLQACESSFDGLILAGARVPNV